MRRAHCLALQQLLTSFGRGRALRWQAAGKQLQRPHAPLQWVCWAVFIAPLPAAARAPLPSLRLAAALAKCGL